MRRPLLTKLVAVCLTTCIAMPLAHAQDAPGGEGPATERISPLADAQTEPAAASGDEAAPDAPSDVPYGDRPLPADYEPGVWPLLASIVPGFILHGSGVFAAGDSDTAAKLLIAEGAGLAGILVGGGLVIGTGASRRFAGPAITVMGAGFALFMQSWFSDIYGSVADGGVGRALSVAPVADIRAGYRYIYDPQFEYAHFAHLRSDVLLGPVRLSPSALVAVDDDNHRLRFAGAWRIWGLDADADTPLDHGSWVDAEAAMTYHNNGTEGFYTLTPELFVLGRLDLYEFAAILGGSFAEFGAGYGYEIYNYELPGNDIGDDSASLLLMRFAYGLYIGFPDAPGFPGYGEVALFYDHRHDDYANGLALGGLAGGPAGHFGLEGHWMVAPDEDGDGWGLGAEFTIGSAIVTGLDVIYRFGGR